MIFLTNNMSLKSGPNPNQGKQFIDQPRTLKVEFRNKFSRKRLKNFFGKSLRKARENFQGENNKRFDLTLFQEDTIRIVFDALHGIDNEEARDEIYLRCVSNRINFLSLSLS